MKKQGWLLTDAGLALILALALLAGCVRGREEVTPEAGLTITRVPEVTAKPTLSPTPAVMPGGGPAGAGPQATPIPLCPNLELVIEFQQMQSMKVGEIPLENVISASGRVPLSVDLSMHPPKVSGEGDLPVSGGGHLGECEFQNSGVLAYRLEGEIIPGSDGYPELHLGGQREMNVAASEVCGGGATTPFEDIGEQVLRYEEGHAVEWSWSAPAAGVEGRSRWVLHILCGE